MRALVLTIALLCVAGTEAATLAPPPWEPAVILALELSPELLPPPALVAALRADLAAINTYDPYFEQFAAAPTFRPGFIYVRLTDSAWNDYLAGQYHGLDALNQQYGPVRIVVLSIIKSFSLDFDQPYNPQALAALYAGATGVQFTAPLRIPGDPPTDISSGAPGRYLYTLEWDDCPLGCLHHHYWEFQVTAGAVTLLRSYGDPPPCLPRAMSFDLDPNTLNLQSMGRWVTATLEPELPASPEEIDIASVRLNGIVPVDTSAPSSIGDVDSDGRPDLTVKFDRMAVELVVPEGDVVPVGVSGRIGSGCFEAIDVIRVIRGHVTSPSAGSVLQGGIPAEVRWDTPTEVEVQSVAVLWSSDDGASWTLVAHELPNSGSYLWTVPSAITDQARVAVVLVESADPSGYEVNGVLGMSDRFVIAPLLGVGGTGVQIALHGSVPNPSTNIAVSFSLPGAEPASLVLYDVIGREVSRRAVGALGAGRHVVVLDAPRSLTPGMYLVHLIQGDRRLVARTVVVR